MKSILKISIAAMLLASTSGCTVDVVSGLDDSLDGRINTLIANYDAALRNAENGWLVSIETGKGYYRFWMEFGDNSRVTMMADYNDYTKTDKDTSTYCIRALQTPTLIFDTYSLLATINDPDEAVSGESGYHGLITDFEFELRNVDLANTNLFYAKGRFNHVNAIFRKATAEEKAGVEAGQMYDRMVQAAFPDVDGGMLARRYIKAQTIDGTDIVLKVVDQRFLYVFWYNSGSKKGKQFESCYNAEVGGTSLHGNLFFPMPIDCNGYTLTALQFDPVAGAYTGIELADGSVLSTTIDFTPPQPKIEDLLGNLGENKIFDQLWLPTALASSMPSNDAKSDLQFAAKATSSGFIGSSGFAVQVFTSSDLYCYFTKTATGQKQFAVSFAPTGLLFEIGGPEGLTGSQFFPEALYVFNVTDDEGFLIFDPNFTTNTGGVYYYNRYAILKDYLDHLAGQAFTLRWSEDCLYTTGLLVEMVNTDNSSYYVPFVLNRYIGEGNVE